MLPPSFVQTDINQGAPIMVYHLSPNVSYSHSLSSAGLWGVGVRPNSFLTLISVGQESVLRALAKICA